MNPMYAEITKNLKLGKTTYSWAKDCFGVWHRSKAGILDDAIESYADGVSRAVFNRHLKEDIETIKTFKTMSELLHYIADVADKEGF